MNNWFTVKVRFTKQLDDGCLKRVTDSYLVAAMSFTDAEAAIYRELREIVRGEFTIVAISRTDVHDIFNQLDEFDNYDYFLLKIQFETTDPDQSKSKVTIQKFLVQAKTVQTATSLLKECLQTLMVDYEIKSVAKSPIVDVFPFYPQEAHVD